MEKKKEKKKKKSVIKLVPYFLVGLFILLLYVGTDHICPEYFQEKERNDLSNRYKLACAMREYGPLSTILIVIVLPIVMNIALYAICGFWISVLFQILIYFSITKKYE